MSREPKLTGNTRVEYLTLIAGVLIDPEKGAVDIARLFEQRDDLQADNAKLRELLVECESRLDAAGTQLALRGNLNHSAPCAELRNKVREALEESHD